MSFPNSFIYRQILTPVNFIKEQIILYKCTAYEITIIWWLTKLILPNYHFRTNRRFRETSRTMYNTKPIVLSCRHMNHVYYQLVHAYRWGNLTKAYNMLLQLTWPIDFKKTLMFSAIIVILYSLSTYIVPYIFLDISSSGPADFWCRNFMFEVLRLSGPLCFSTTFLNYIY